MVAGLGDANMPPTSPFPQDPNLLILTVRQRINLMAWTMTKEAPEHIQMQPSQTGVKLSI
jgi:hypothetical protein